MESKYAPSDDPVFALVPGAFAVHANAIWTAMGSPRPHFHNSWAIYVQIRDTLKSVQYGLDPFLSNSAKPQDNQSEDIRDISLLMDWEDFSDHSDGGSAQAGPSRSSSLMADLTEDETDGCD